MVKDYERLSEGGEALIYATMTRLIAGRQLEAYESARLFVQRARLESSGFTLAPENARAVAEICRRLEGIPLALELAATRVGTLSPQQISDRLKGPLTLLRGSGRTAMPCLERPVRHI